VTTADSAYLKRRRHDWADTLLFQLKASKLPLPVREFRFHAVRKFRFDCAWPERMLATELSGGEWINGMHNRGTGLARDYTKLNLAQLDGWVVLQFTGNQVKDGSALAQLAKVLNG